MKGKIVVALICHFSNREVQERIKPWKKIHEFAPWIPPFISIFENCESVEFHLISPHEYIWLNKTFNERNIKYHFFNAHMPVIGRHWPGIFKFDFWTDFRRNKNKVKNIVKRINPDIIHLFGAENAYYSSTILQFTNLFPIVITVQGFIFKTSFNQSIHTRKRIEIEQKIIATNNYYITNTETIGRDIVALNPMAHIFQINLPINIPEPVISEKRYDLVFFARICKDKGIEDLLKAAAVIKQEKPDLTLCVIGGGKLDIWKEMAKELGLSKNVFWAGFLPTQKDVHNLASTARICVLPTYHDIISGTIVESLFLKLPVVAYNVGSIHEVNKHEKIISLVDKSDINGLAGSVLMLLNNENLRAEIAEKGYARANEMFNAGSDAIREELINIYSEVINDFNMGS